MSTIVFTGMLSDIATAAHTSLLPVPQAMKTLLHEILVHCIFDDKAVLHLLLAAMGSCMLQGACVSMPPAISNKSASPD